MLANERIAEIELSIPINKNPCKVDKGMLKELIDEMKRARKAEDFWRSVVENIQQEIHEAYEEIDFPAPETPR